MSGELDWIVMKCLEKERNRRYETATGIAADIERYLNEETVQACPPSRSYRLKKFARRNKASVLAGSAIAAALIVGLILASIGFIQARRQAGRADREANNARAQALRSDQVAQFLKDTLAAAGPRVAQGRDATLLREVLDTTSERIERDLKHQPEVQGDLWFTLGQTYADIGDHVHAINTYQHAVESYRAALGSQNTKLAWAMCSLGHAQSYIGNVETGKAIAQHGLEMARKCGDPETLGRCLVLMGGALESMGRFSPDAEPFFRESLQLQKKLQNDPIALASSMRRVAVYTEDDEESESLCRQAWEIHRDKLGNDHPTTASSLWGLGQRLLGHGKFAEAEAVLRDAWNVRLRIYSGEHPQQPIVLRNLAQALLSQNKGDEAEALVRKQTEAFPKGAEYWQLLGWVHSCRGQWPEAAQAISRAIEINPGDHANWRDLAIVHFEIGQQEEFRAHCHSYLDRFGENAIIDQAGSAIKLALLLPTKDPDFQRACQLADSLAAQDSTAWWAEAVKAQADYRRGRFELATELADKAIGQGDGFAPRNATTWFNRAAASARMLQMDAAQAAMNKGDDLIEQAKEIGTPFMYDWGEWRIADIMRRQAAELLSTEESAPSVDQQPSESATSVPTPAP